MLAYIGAILVMILGFGFVIFWHELGHFLGARWAKMRVEQFAVGMGHAVVSYRKGIGLKLGSTRQEFEQRVQKVIDEEQAQQRIDRDLAGRDITPAAREPSLREKYDIAKSLGIGETEYRLAWIPIGGYVKPTGQDDLRPRALAANDDPGSYAAAPVGKRMVMISAGVVMNVILAAILFFVLFRFIGFNAPRPIPSSVQFGSPAADAGLRSGDELVSLHGHTLHDFTKVQMWTALMPDDEPVDLVFRRDGQEMTQKVQLRPSRENANMLSLGLSPPLLLKAASNFQTTDEFNQLPPERRALLPGDAIVAVNGKPTGEADYAVFERALRDSFGAPIALSIRGKDGTTRETTITPHIAAGFDGRQIDFVGMSPRTMIAGVPDNSCAKGKLQAGDIILSVRGTTAESIVFNPSNDLFRSIVTDAGRDSAPLTFTVLRGEEMLEIEPIVPTNQLADKKYGLGVMLGADFDHAVISTHTLVQDTSAPASVPAGALLTAIDGKPVKDWNDILRVLSSFDRPTKVFVTAVTRGGEQTLDLALDEAAITRLAGIRYDAPFAIPFESWTRQRKTESALTAIGWGATETRDLILQTYVTLRRVVTGSVPASNLSGPIGIFKTGTLLAQKGTDWFIWFLALVSANLAVVNFLPIPILDGWHFLSLLKEKITGTPVNERVQEYASWLGLALILSLLIFVTFNDLTR